jgi:hypothetical protein
MFDWQQMAIRELDGSVFESHLERSILFRGVRLPLINERSTQGLNLFSSARTSSRFSCLQEVQEHFEVVFLIVIHREMTTRL